MVVGELIADSVIGRMSEDLISDMILPLSTDVNLLCLQRFFLIPLGMTLRRTRSKTL